LYDLNVEDHFNSIQMELCPLGESEEAVARTALMPEFESLRAMTMERWDPSYNFFVKVPLGKFLPGLNRRPGL
jgi:hypothetical protein